MVSEPSTGDSDRLGVRLDSKNYAVWEFQFRIFVEGKGLLPILEGTSPQPIVPPATEQALERWTMNNARVKTWLLGSIDPSIVLGLRLFTTAAEMWSHLRATYTTSNTAREFEIETELAALKQGDMDIATYYNRSVQLWTEEDLLSTSLRSAALSEDVRAERNQSRLLRFLMKLRPEFESVRSSLLNRDDLKFEGVVGRLLQEETRLRTQEKLDIRPGASEAVFSAEARAADDITAYAATRPQFQQRTTELTCSFCEEKGHVQKLCKKRNICVYCKRSGHIISECRTLQRRQQYVAQPGRTGSTSSRPAQAAYAVQQVDTAASPISVDAVEKLVQSALQKSLPGAINTAFAALQVSGKAKPWLLDSACFNHMTSDPLSLRNVRPVNNLRLQVANGEHISVTGVGLVSQPRVQLNDVMHVPKLTPNLVSVGQLIDDNCSVLFAPSGCFVQDLTTGRLIGRGSKKGRTFTLEELSSRGCLSPSESLPLPQVSSVSRPMSFSSTPVVFSSQSDNSWTLWHNRLGHPNSSRLQFMFKQQLLGNKSVVCSSKLPCSSCVEAKVKSISFPSSSTVITEPFHLIHTDLWGPSPITSRNGYKYFALFIDHATRYTWVYFLHLKSDLYEVATEFLTMIRTQFGKNVKIIRSDPGGEFSSNPLLAYYKAHGILCQKSYPGVSQQNGVVERKNRHSVELTRALLLASSVPTRFWPEAVSTAIRLINYQVTPVLNNQSPHFALYGNHPDYSRLRVFGCLCFVLLPRRERHKLSSKTVRCAFLGYSDIHKGYLCYDPSLGRIRIACHVVFFENVMFYESSSSESVSLLFSSTHLPSFGDDIDYDGAELPPDMPPPSPTSTLPMDSAPPSPTSSSSSSTLPTVSSPAVTASASSSSAPGSASPSSSATSHQPPPAATRHSRRANFGQPPARFGDFVAHAVAFIPIPTRYSQAKGNPDWDNAMTEEFNALDANHTWTIVDRPPPGVPVVGCRWLYNLKFHPDGSLERHKARVVAQGFTQEYGIDFDETFAPVAKMQTVRTLLAVAALRNWPLYQLDIKNAFLHGDLKEVVYMEIPPGYPSGSPDQVCLLHRSLYGLKQAPRAWFEKFQYTILSFGFQQSQNDPSLFTQSTSRGRVVLLIYVDDMIVTGDDDIGIAQLKANLRAAFSLKDLGSLSYFLGIEVHRSNRGILLSQHKYVNDLLEEHRFADCMPVRTPIELNLKLGKESGELLADSRLYRSIVGSLIYLVATRPDIAYAVQLVSQFMAAPRVDHMAAVHRIL
ncbi:unnamed protein product [Linum trigynum]|uniref:Integrase catalytic domain-containing protein n=1 Tax=Linum trigynum TaxID=586398 RepID=A0AAV2F4F9_9ROSI